MSEVVNNEFPLLPPRCCLLEYTLFIFFRNRLSSILLASHKYLTYSVSKNQSYFHYNFNIHDSPRHIISRPSLELDHIKPARSVYEIRFFNPFIFS